MNETISSWWDFARARGSLVVFESCFKARKTIIDVHYNNGRNPDGYINLSICHVPHPIIHDLRTANIVRQ